MVRTGTAVKMDATRKRVHGKASILSLKKAFFDGMHSRCKGYKTLTLWTHHPGMRRMNRLATMECKKEDTEMVEIFFRLFNEALANFLGEEGYKFNPTMLCMDEAGQTYKVYGMFSVMLLCHGLCHVNGTLWNVHGGNCDISMSMIKQHLCITLG